MKLIEAYRLAIIENLTAREAGSKYGVSGRSLAKIKGRYNLPSLRSELSLKYEGRLNYLSNTQLKSYWEALQLPKNADTSKTEKELVRVELVKRSLSVRAGVTD